MEQMQSLSCNAHTLVSHVAVINGNAALLVKYADPDMFDGEGGWFLPNDGLSHVEHPEAGARRILKEQVGLEKLPFKLMEIESFIGNNKSWHLIFDFLTTAPSRDFQKGELVGRAEWFDLDKLPPAYEFAHHGWGRGVLLKYAKTKT